MKVTHIHMLELSFSIQLHLIHLFLRHYFTAYDGTKAHTCLRL